MKETEADAMEKTVVTTMEEPEYFEEPIPSWVEEEMNPRYQENMMGIAVTGKY